jgi:hypothetical protein
MVYGVPKGGIISVIIYNAYGSKIITNNYTILKPGYYMLKYKSDDFSNGIYFIMLKQDNNTVIKKFIVI